MSLKTDLMGVGVAPELAQRIGLDIATLAGIGTAQSGAAAIVAELTIGTTAGGATAFVLPSTAELAKPYIFVNSSATSALLFPPTSGAINGGSANASISIEQDGVVMLWRVSATAWRGIALESQVAATAGDVENGKIVVAGAADDAVAILDFSAITLANGANVIRGAALDYEDTTGWLVFSGNTEADAFRYSAYFQPQSAGSAKLLGIGNTGILQSGWSGNVAEAAQLHLIVQSGATVTSRAADPTAGIHPIWAKVAGEVGATWNTGMRVAPIWADMQINGVGLTDEEAFMFLVSSGTAIEAMIRWETAAACNYFLQTDHSNGTGFLAASGFDQPNAATAMSFIKVDINGTPGAIPVMAAT
jgi:hypothetical protein